jgi:hypothetical protein
MLPLINDNSAIAFREVSIIYVKAAVANGDQLLSVSLNSPARGARMKAMGA